MDDNRISYPVPVPLHSSLPSAKDITSDEIMFALVITSFHPGMADADCLAVLYSDIHWDSLFILHGNLLSLGMQPPRFRSGHTHKEKKMKRN